jgi:hypothetical protein
MASEAVVNHDHRRDSHRAQGSLEDHQAHSDSVTTFVMVRVWWCEAARVVA